MKYPALKLLTVVCAVVLFSACKKEVVPAPSNPYPENDYTRATGALPDDPAMVAKVPVIMSAGFLKDKQNLESAMAANRPRKDGTAPLVTITSPSNGSVVSGTVTIQVAASDNIGVSSVSVSVDGVSMGTRTAAPYSFSWSASSGNHTIVATAKDGAGNTGQHSISVSDNTVAADVTAPTVSITSPANGSAVSGTVTVALAASDNVGIASVSLSVDGVLVGTLNSSPYNFSWNSSNVADGNHTLTAKALDAAGNSSTHSIMVSKNTTTLPPANLPSGFSLAMPPVQSQGTEGSCVSFAVGYAARSAEQYYKTNSSSYGFSTNTFSPEYLYNQTKVDASCTSGSSLLTALDFLKYVGICTWQSMPYSSANGCALMPSSTQNAEAANFKIASYSSIYSSDITAIKNLLYDKHPLLITVALDQSFYNAGPGFIWKSYTSTNGALHTIAICGYDDARNAVKIINSWGTGWGDAGYTWIDYDFLPTLSSHVYKMTL